MSYLPKIAWIGLGIMGSPMAENLIKAGYAVTGYTLEADKLERLANNGGTADVTGPPPFLSPFCAVRSDEILEVVRARFDVVHEGGAGALFPLFLLLDLPALEREEPALLKVGDKVSFRPISKEEYATWK